jgi:hypothetical protein
MIFSKEWAPAKSIITESMCDRKFHERAEIFQKVWIRVQHQFDKIRWSLSHSTYNKHENEKISILNNVQISVRNNSRSVYEWIRPNKDDV